MEWPDDLLDTAGISKLIGLSRQHVTDVMTKRPDFPAPFINTSQRFRKWRRADVLEFICGDYLKRQKKTKQRPKATAEPV